jgi:Mg-chelatase subunit ChlD
MTRRFVAPMLCSVIGLGIIAQACATSDDLGFAPLPSATTTSSSSSGATSSSGSSSSSSGIVPFVPMDGGTSSSSSGSSGISDGGMICAAQPFEGKRLPLDIILLLDTSGSMTTQVQTGTSKYLAVKNALATFFSDGDSAGIGVGLQTFPLLKPNTGLTCTSTSQCGASGPCVKKQCSDFLGQPTNDFCVDDGNCGLFGSCNITFGRCANDASYTCPEVGRPCGNDPNGFALGNCVASAKGFCGSGDDPVSCDVTRYADLTAAPAVPVTTLPGATAALTARLNSLGDNLVGTTPTSAVLQGGVNAAKQYAAANPGHTVVLVLATDGLPTACQTDTNAIAAIAKAGATGNPGVKTFVIGVFPANETATAQPVLDKIALEGGTKKAYLVTANASTTTEFVKALNDIRETSAPCEYEIPKATMGTLDFNKVNVEFKPVMGASEQIGNRPNEAACAGAAGDAGADGGALGKKGWYYDKDPGAGQTPTKILLCPASCNAVKADKTAKVNVLVGCETIPSGPN